MKYFHKFLFVVGGIFTLNAYAQSVPPVVKGVEYPTYRKSLIKEGWTPVKRGGQCGFTCQGYRAEGYIETEDCGDAGLAPCTFIFKNKESVVLKVHTAGENLAVQKTVGGGASSAPAQSASPTPPVARPASRPARPNVSQIEAQCKRALEPRIPKTKNYGGAIGLAKVHVTSIQMVNQIYEVSRFDSGRANRSEFGKNNYMYGTVFTQDTSTNPQMAKTGSFNGAYTFECVFPPDGSRFAIQNLSSR